MVYYVTTKEDTLNSARLITLPRIHCVYLVYFLLIRSSIDPAFCGMFVCGPLQFKCSSVIKVKKPQGAKTYHFSSARFDRQ